MSLSKIVVATEFAFGPGYMFSVYGDDESRGRVDHTLMISCRHFDGFPEHAETCFAPTEAEHLQYRVVWPVTRKQDLSGSAKRFDVIVAMYEGINLYIAEVDPSAVEFHPDGPLLNIGRKGASGSLLMHSANSNKSETITIEKGQIKVILFLCKRVSRIPIHSLSKYIFTSRPYWMLEFPETDNMIIGINKITYIERTDEQRNDFG